MAVACLQSSVTDEYDCDLYVFLLRAICRHVGSSKLGLERLGGRKALATRNRFQPSRSSGRGLLAMTSLWVFDERDCRERSVRFLGSYSCHVAAAEVPPCVRELDGVAVKKCQTNGNGKCGMHAIFGVPISGELKVADERSFVLNMLGRSYSEIRAELLAVDVQYVACNLQILDNVVSKIWSSFIQPKFELEYKGIRSGASVERRLYEEEFVKDPGLCDAMRDHYLGQVHRAAEQDSRKNIFMEKIRNYFSSRQQHLPFWYTIASHKNVLPPNCLEELMSADVQLQRNCIMQHRDNYLFLRDDNVMARHSCKFLALFDVENSMYDKDRFSFLYELCNHGCFLTLPSIIEGIMEIYLVSDTLPQWLASSLEVYSELLDVIRVDVLPFTAEVL